MADRRMVCIDIVEGDSFASMPAEAQMLYIHLMMYADDWGFVGNPRQVMRLHGASDDSMKLLIAKKFVLTFKKEDNFIVLIKHWKMHNYIRGDRLKESRFKEFLRGVYYDENNSYSINPNDGHIPCLPSSVNCLSSDSQVTVNCLSSDSIGKVRLGKASIGEDSLDKDKDKEDISIFLSNEKKLENPSMDWRELAKFAIKMGNFDNAKHYAEKSAEEGFPVDLNELVNELGVSNA